MCGLRLAVVMASGRTVPAASWPIASDMLENASCTSPGDHRGGRQGAAAIGHGGELGAGLDAEDLRRELHEAAGADRAVAEAIGHTLAERGELAGGSWP